MYHHKEITKSNLNLTATAKKYLPSVSFGENRVDPEQTSTVWVHKVCQKATRTFQQIIKQTTFVVIGTLRVKF